MYRSMPVRVGPVSRRSRRRLQAGTRRSYSPEKISTLHVCEKNSQGCLMRSLSKQSFRSWTSSSLTGSHRRNLLKRKLSCSFLCENASRRQRSCFSHIGKDNFPSLTLCGKNMD